MTAMNRKIIITVVQAQRVLEHMISVCPGKAPLKRYELEKPTLVEAKKAVLTENEVFAANKINHQVYATCYGKKPRMWHRNRLNLNRTWVE